MTNLQARYVVVRQAIEVLLRHLEGLPPSGRSDQLRVCIEECGAELGEWTAAPQSDRDGDDLMKRLLALHIEVTKLEHNALLAAPRRLGGSPGRSTCVS